jgi:predicted MFS family arabinose efflux permease
MAADHAPRAHALETAASSLAAVLRNGAIRNLQVAWSLGIGADWALLVVALLVAYDAGGPALVGLVSLTRMIPATLVNVFIDTGRLARPERALVAVALVRAAAAGVTAAAIVLGVPALVFVAVASASAAGALVRPTMMGLLPAVATTPDELVSANVVTALGESLGTFAGPLLAGIVVARSGPVSVAALAAAVCVVVAVVVLRVHVSDAARQPAGERPAGPAIAEGLRELRQRPPAAAVMGSFFAQTAVRGALTTYLAIISIELLGMGDAGVGILGAAIGVGGLVGAFVALALGARRGLAPMHVTALVLWGAPIAVIGLVPVPPVALVALGIVGIGNALLDVAGLTLLQRGIPNRSRSAVFSVLEAGIGITISAGGVAGALLLQLLGIEAALVATGLVLPLVAILAWGPSRRLDRGAVIPEHRAALLRAIPLFRPLPLAALERLAAGMRPVTFAVGERLMTEGEPGATYLVIERGEAEVTATAHVLRRVGPGEGVGEIALLRAVPRTATVTALGAVDAWEIGCGTFTDAVTGHPGSTAAASIVVEERLGQGSAGAG